MSIQEQARQILIEVFGPNTGLKVDKFAEESPPDKKGKEFLDKCSGLVKSYISESVADEKFSALYAMVK